MIGMVSGYTARCQVCGELLKFDKTEFFASDGWVHEACVRASFQYSMEKLRQQGREFMMQFWKSIRIPQLVRWLNEKLK